MTTGDGRREMDVVGEPLATPAQTKRPTRQQQRKARWRVTKSVLLDGLRELRASEEAGLLRSPSLEGARLLLPWRPDEMPLAPDPRERPWEGDAHSAADESAAARSWRERQAAYERAVAWRRSVREAKRMRPGNTWRNLGTAGERGGMPAGMTAYPLSWSGYLGRLGGGERERGGVEEPGSGGSGGSGGSRERVVTVDEGWDSPLGVAFRRIERGALNTGASARWSWRRGGDGVPMPLYRALWLWTDPRRRTDLRMVDLARMLSVDPERPMSERQAYRWLDAAAKRLHAEVEAQARGRSRTDAERRQANEAEAEAWQHETDDE